MRDINFDFDRQGRTRWTSAVILTGVILAAAAGLASMRFLSSADAEIPNPPSFDPRDARLNRVLQEPVPEAIIVVLPEKTTAPDVETRGDPFPAEGPGPAGTFSRELREKEIEHAARLLRVQGIMTGSHTAASVGELMVRVGDVIEVPLGETRSPVSFRVRSISGKAVKLVAEEHDLDLEVETVLELERP